MDNKNILTFDWDNFGLITQDVTVNTMHSLFKQYYTRLPGDKRVTTEITQHTSPDYLTISKMPLNNNTIVPKMGPAILNYVGIELEYEIDVAISFLLAN